MKTHQPKIIAESNLSVAWVRAFLHVLGNDDPGCLVVAIRGFSADVPPQDTEIARALDDFLRMSKSEVPTINQTALTIMPYERWLRMNKPDLPTIKNWYLEQFLPRLKARCTKNRHGTYFERLVRYSGARS
jgi:hypothetical protein